MKQAILVSFIICLMWHCAPQVKNYVIPENYASWKKTTNVELNYPIPGHLEALKGWLWIVQDLKKPLNEYSVFTSDFCLDCHTDANRSHNLGTGNPDEEFRDYVFFPYDVSKE